MSAGDYLIALAAISSFGVALARTVGENKMSRKTADSAAATLSVLTFVIVTGALVYLIYLFMTSDMNYLYVWSYSSTDLSNIYKLSGVWAGASGSFLLWIWFMALVLVVEVLLEPKRRYLSRRFHSLFQAATSGIILLFLVLLMGMDLFAGTNTLQRAYYPEGWGMALVLQTPEMIVHPPVVFAGYAFCVAALTAAISYYISEERNWFMVSLPWSRLAWIFLTLGIGIGAIWAYYVLGWGGYWAWDPVETASLVPWFVVTAFLHTQTRHSRKSEYGVLSPALGMLSFVAVVFATFATRAGGIWSQSVHTFGGGGSSETGLSRLFYLLENDNTVLGLFSLILFLLALTVHFAYAKYSKTPRLDEQPEPGKFSEYISDRNNMLLTVALLLVTGAVMLLLLFKNVDVAQSANYDEFNQKMSLFFVILMVTMTICLVWKMLGKEMALRLGVGLIVASVSLGAVFALADVSSWLVGFSLPSYVVAVGASAVRLAKSRGSGSVRKTVHKLGPHIVHLGIALILMSYVVSSELQQLPGPSEGAPGAAGFVVPLGGGLDVGDYTIVLTDLDIRLEHMTSGYTVSHEAREATFDILRSGEALRQGVVVTDLYSNSTGVPTVVEIEVVIHKAVLEDLYFNFQWRNETSVYLEAKTVPMMNTLWLGLGLVVVGVSARTLAWQLEPKEAIREPRKATGRDEGKKPPSRKEIPADGSRSD